VIILSNLYILEFIILEAMSDLTIARLSDSSASVRGGREIILLCEKVIKGKKKKYIL